ncbi:MULTISPECIES: YiaA/YiaB family inner membrane protein [unclassified Aureispira]|uniref:YiaA/YiaB family inner membrane protein n=1 Tax=unclassified Aureispira TaxID=2649989 RepID=UPI000696505E|nr:MULTISPECIES: YiaA/YiaB family inner membrane protein [unclassified Aureispira]WMX15509.1 YiaA/YiaB family inner membrane protein [Aureispira sp. CCB-E]
MSTKYQNSNTQAFSTLAWISFGVSFIGMVIGLIYLQMDIYQKAFIGMTYLFSISSCFVLAKVVRDKQESEDYVKKIENAKTEQMLSKYIGTEES